nr:MAG TPA_asm: hypothetical protein [Caudoviricetes sp.]
MTTKIPNVIKQPLNNFLGVIINFVNVNNVSANVTKVFHLKENISYIIRYTYQKNALNLYF